MEDFYLRKEILLLDAGPIRRNRVRREDLLFDPQVEVRGFLGGDPPPVLLTSLLYALNSLFFTTICSKFSMKENKL